jgi:predicted glutamine amidotransferase
VSGRLREHEQRLGVDERLVLPLTQRVERPLNDEAASFLADDGRMCRLFGLHAGGAAVPATFWLLDAPDSLAAQSHRNPDGAGIGTFDDAGAPTLDKEPLAAWHDSEFATAARELRGTTFVAHVRYASTGARTLTNTHPFLQERRLFAHNGVVHGLDELDSRLTRLGAQVLVQGQTDSERIFALVTAETSARGGDLSAGLVAAVRWISDHLPVYSLNLLLSTATDLWALRYPATHALYVLQRAPGGAGSSRALEASSHRIHARSHHLAVRACVLVASEPMDDDPGWRLLDAGELVHVDAGLGVSSSRPLIAAPRHPLVRTDLDPNTAASQHPGLPRPA